MAEYPRALDYTTLQGQQALIRQLNREQEAQERVETARVLLSFRALATNVDFQIVLDSWMARLMLVELTNETEMHKHNFVVQVLTDLRESTKVRR